MRSDGFLTMGTALWRSHAFPLEMTPGVIDQTCHRSGRGCCRRQLVATGGVAAWSKRGVRRIAAAENGRVVSDVFRKTIGHSRLIMRQVEEIAGDLILAIVHEILHQLQCRQNARTSRIKTQSGFYIC